MPLLIVLLLVYLAIRLARSLSGSGPVGTEGKLQGGSQPPGGEPPGGGGGAGGGVQTTIKTVKVCVELGGLLAGYPAIVSLVASWFLSKAEERAAVKAAGSTKSTSWYREKVALASGLGSGSVVQVSIIKPILWSGWGGIVTWLARLNFVVTCPTLADPLELVRGSAFYRALVSGEEKAISLESFGIPLSGKATRAGNVWIYE